MKMFYIQTLIVKMNTNIVLVSDKAWTLLPFHRLSILKFLGLKKGEFDEVQLIMIIY